MCPSFRTSLAYGLFTTLGGELIRLNGVALSLRGVVRKEKWVLISRRPAEELVYRTEVKKENSEHASRSFLLNRTYMNRAICSKVYTNAAILTLLPTQTVYVILVPVCKLCYKLSSKLVPLKRKILKLDQFPIILTAEQWPWHAWRSVGIMYLKPCKALTNPLCTGFSRLNKQVKASAYSRPDEIQNYLSALFWDKPCILAFACSRFFKSHMTTTES